MVQPATTATLPRPAGTIVIQPGTQTRGQPMTLTQPQAPRVISQPTPSMPAPSIAHPQPAVGAVANVSAAASAPELSECMFLVWMTKFLVLKLFNCTWWRHWWYCHARGYMYIGKCNDMLCEALCGWSEDLYLFQEKMNTEHMDWMNTTVL